MPISSRLDASIDERYTVPYIEREAFLLLRHFGGRKSNRFRDKNIYNRDLDKRILRSYGVM